MDNKKDDELEARIYELGNGFPREGAYLRDDDQLYRVVSFFGPIHIGNSAIGESNYVYGYVVKASDDDCAEEDEYPAAVEIVGE